MALIEDFVRRDFEPRDRQASVVGFYKAFERDGRRFLQINTYGSAGRKNPDIPSQTIRLDEAGAAKLRAILDEAFPPL